MKAGRPSLVIMSSIQETMEFSASLKSRGIEHQILNDVQTEDEDYILRRAGHPKAVTIATNAAGRGTDIILSGASESAGGLHTIVAFFPVNFRVECQAYGRSGRQGQRGTCQIICSLDEDFIADDLGISDRNTPVDSFYSKRSIWIRFESFRRLQSVKRDKIFFRLLQHYFAYVAELVEQLDCINCSKCQVELVHAERIWCQFFGDLDEQLREVPSEDTEEAWALLKFEEFRNIVRQLVDD
jgi:hypothetical protein